MIEKSQSERIFGLDLMRAAAILMVLSSHILWIYPPQSSLLSQVFQLFGFLGVEVFFVLSGFLIGTIFYKLYLKDNFKISTVFYFLKKRWFRTLPNYYLFFIVNIIIGLIIGYPLPSLWKYLIFLQNLYTTMLPFYPDSWSLAIEEYTYVILPFSVFLITFLVKPKNKKTTYIIVVLSLICLFILNKGFYNASTKNTTLIQWNVSLKDIVMYRLDAILYGVVFSWICINYTTFWKKHKVNLAFLGLVFLLFMYVGIGFFQITIERFPMFWNVFYLPITSVTMALFLPILSEWKTTTLPFKNTIVTISLVSYSYYLIHYGIVLQLMKYYINTEGLQLYQLHIYALVFLVLSWGLSYLNFKYFEKPMMDLRDKF
jgi:peptidoglycan/LPS O-acetylase OafA/YrhL